MRYPVIPETTESLILAFVNYLFFIRNLSHSTCKSYTASLKSWFTLTGAPTLRFFNNGRLRSSFKAIKKLCPSKTGNRLPIHLWLLRKICASLYAGNADDIMFADMFTVAFFGFLRSAELTGHAFDEFQNYLTFANVSFHDSLGFVELSIDGSKTDVFREGTLIKLFRSSQTSVICPVKAMQRRFRTRPRAATGSTAVFTMRSGRPVSYKLFQEKLKATIRKLGYNPKEYSTHSFRIGAATTMAILGFPAHQIKAMGRWKSLAFQLYARLDDSTLRKISSLMAGADDFVSAVTSSKVGGGCSSLGMINTIESSVSIDDVLVSFATTADYCY